MRRTAWLLGGLCAVALMAAGIGFGVGYVLNRPPGPVADAALSSQALPPAAANTKVGSPAARLANDASQRATLSADLANLAPQRPGQRDLFVLGFAGDGSETVFLNEVLYLRDLAAQRFDAAGRMIVLANHAPLPPERPWPGATRANLRRALAGLAQRMDPEEDILLAYFTTHGSEDHELLVRREGRKDRALSAGMIREALDEAGIRHRVIAISACYAGGLLDALEGPDTLALAAARHDRTSFGCGNDSVATFFGRAWLVEGLNETLDFSEAFHRARLSIATREAIEALRPSRPQIARGARIEATLAAWRAGVEPGPALPYPHAEPGPYDDIEPDDGDEAAVIIPARPPAGTSR